MSRDRKAKGTGNTLFANSNIDSIINGQERQESASNDKDYIQNRRHMKI